MENLHYSKCHVRVKLRNLLRRLKSCLVKIFSGNSNKVNKKAGRHLPAFYHLYTTLKLICQDLKLRVRLQLLSGDLKIKGRSEMLRPFRLNFIYLKSF